MDVSADLTTSRLGKAIFVLLTTYRATGVAVDTPVWVVADGNQIAVLTNADTGKVRRLRRNPAVTVVPCNFRGVPVTAVTPISGQADIVTDEDYVAHLWGLIRRKYAVPYVILRVIAVIKPSTNRWSGTQIALRITLDRAAS